MSSIILAQVIGLFSVIMGASMLVRRKMLLDIFKEIFSNRALSYIMGVTMLVIGLLLVRQHNIWNGTTEVVVTLLGWGILLESLTYLFLTQKFLKNYVRWLKNEWVYFVIAALYLGLGIYLTYAGFFGDL